jgi:glutamate N-acetyltransferase/amino-acid N-acetyltransferase
MTTDKAPKTAMREFDVDGRPIRIWGMAKGAGMIGPNMATMLGVVLTDAAISPVVAQPMLADVAAVTFNCISVDGHTSTNDSLVFMASGAVAHDDMSSQDVATFQQALEEVCTDLARAIADDGEGATHLIEIRIDGASTDDEAICLAQSVANSPLVKTAIAGNDPNWGRIVSAAGYAGIPFDASGVVLRLNGVTLFEDGTPVAFDAEAVSQTMQENREVLIELDFVEGDGVARFWTSDLTKEYVRINADYHT